MKNSRVAHGFLSIWAMFAGLSLWVPAWAVPITQIPIQSMDVVVVLGYPILLLFLKRILKSALWVLVPAIISVSVSWFVSGGEGLILIWTVAFALPFVALMSLVLGSLSSTRRFLQAFFMAGALSVALFMTQVFFGVEPLDFRTNMAFRLPPQFGRGFALFPEVSTFASHVGLVAGMALVLALHRTSSKIEHQRALLMLLLCAVALLFSRSTSVLIILPLLFAAGLSVTTRFTLNTLFLATLLAGLLCMFLTMFIAVFYDERVASSSATRSVAMRLASILAGLTPLINGETFGVGIGRNDLLQYRVSDVAAKFDLHFGVLPDGVNSQIVGRIFEEGWFAFLQLGIGVFLLANMRNLARRHPENAVLFVLAVGSLLSALLVTGYRGIYTNWIWLAVVTAWAKPVIISIRLRPRRVAIIPSGVAVRPIDC